MSGAQRNLVAIEAEKHRWGVIPVPISTAQV
jgi:hypothetical protein